MPQHSKCSIFGQSLIKNLGKEGGIINWKKLSPPLLKSAVKTEAVEDVQKTWTGTGSAPPKLPLNPDRYHFFSEILARSSVSESIVGKANWMSMSRLSTFPIFSAKVELALQTLSRSALFNFHRYQHSDSSVDDKDNGDKDKPNTSTDKGATPSKESETYDHKKDEFFTQDSAFGSKENKGAGNQERPVYNPEETGNDSEEELVAPTNCCQSGCSNCVWIEYVEKLSKRFADPSLGRERILKELEEIDDQNIKAFIMMELRWKKLI